MITMTKPIIVGTTIVFSLLAVPAATFAWTQCHPQKHHEQKKEEHKERKEEKHEQEEEKHENEEHEVVHETEVKKIIIISKRPIVKVIRIVHRRPVFVIAPANNTNHIVNNNTNNNTNTNNNNPVITLDQHVEQHTGDVSVTQNTNSHNN